MTDVETTAREHARRIIAGDVTARGDLAAGALVDPPDLLDRLLAGHFRDFELVAHARIGAYHIFKTRYVGSNAVIVQARWVPVPGGGWQVAEAELARVGVDDGA